MKIAVLMSTYNGELYLRAQIDSILKQNVDADLTLIVRDDGSTDSTVSILMEYEKNTNVKVFYGKNIGPAKSFISLLINNPGYDFYAFSDQDDVWNLDKIKRGVTALYNYDKPALYFSNSELVDEKMLSMNRNTYRKDLAVFSLVSMLSFAKCAQGCTSIFNKHLASIIQNNEMPSIFRMHDSLVSCVCALVNGTIIYDKEASMKYRMHKNNVDGILSAKKSFFYIIIKRLLVILRKKNISMYAQTECLLDVYKKHISQENYMVGELVLQSKHSLLSRIKLFFRNDLVSTSLNLTITKKLEILFGNA